MRGAVGAPIRYHHPVSRNAVRITVSLVLTAALLALFLWRVDLDEVGATLAGADPGWLLAATGLALLSYWLRAVRWQLILRPVGGIRHSSVVLATASGYAAMSLLPARMGDLVRPLLLARRDRRPASALLASILTERILDLWTVVAFFLVFVLWPPPMVALGDQAQRSLELLNLSGILVGAGLLAGTLFLVGLLRFQERLVRLVTAPLARLPERWRLGAASFLNHFLDGLRALQRPRDLALTLAASVLLWYVIYWQVTVTLYAFDIDLPLRASLPARDPGGDRPRRAHPRRRRRLPQGDPDRSHPVLRGRARPRHRGRHRLPRHLLPPHHRDRPALPARLRGQPAPGRPAVPERHRPGTVVGRPRIIDPGGRP